MALYAKVYKKQVLHGFTPGRLLKTESLSETVLCSVSGDIVSFRRSDLFFSVSSLVSLL
jgi:hypothetical protein